MLNYANSFSLSVNDSKSEFILTFSQRSPIINETGAVSEIKVDEVSSIVLNKDGFQALQMLLNSTLSE